MAKDPAVLFYTSDFLTGTILMNYEQKGKYITLLCIQHQHGIIDKNSFDLIIEAELEAKPWYLAAARRTIKTGTLAGTGGQPIVQERLRSGGGIEYECLFDFGVVVEDFRGLYKNLVA